MGIHNSENKGEIIDFALARQQKQSTCQSTQEQVNSILEEKEEKFSKGDIIGALLNLSNTPVDNNLASDLLSIDYKKLLFNLYDGICEELGPIYQSYGLDLIFDSKDFCIYLGEKDSQLKHVKLDIALLSNADFSETHIIISHNGNEMFFFKNQDEFGKTTYLPPEIHIKTIQEDLIETNAANDESENTLDNEYHRIFINIITTHFPQAFEIYKDEFETLHELEKGDLYTIIVEMVYLECKDELKLHEHPQNGHFLQREIQKDDKIIFEDVVIGFDTSGKTQNIYLFNSNNECFAEIVE